MWERGGGERERERFVVPLFMHSLVHSRSCPDQGLNPQSCGMILLTNWDVQTRLTFCSLYKLPFMIGVQLSTWELPLPSVWRFPSLYVGWRFSDYIFFHCLLPHYIEHILQVGSFLGKTGGGVCVCLGFLKDFIYLSLERGEGKEKERERNISVWLPPMHSHPGTWPPTQACALTGNQTGDPLVCRLALNPLSYTSQGKRKFFETLCIWRYICTTLTLEVW